MSGKKSENPLTVVWFRQDLRIEDHPALEAAFEENNRIIALYIWSPEEEEPWQIGAASRWWLHHSLKVLKQELEKKGIPFILRKGPYHQVFKELAQHSIKKVFWNRCYEPHALQRDQLLKSALTSEGIEVRAFKANLLFEPWEIANKQKKPFQVFTPFWNSCLKKGVEEGSIASIKSQKTFEFSLKSLPLEKFDLLPKIPWDAGIAKTWKPGCVEAKKALNYFLKNKVDDYLHQRDFPAIDGTSRLSPFLHFGEISAKMIWMAMKEGENPENREKRKGFLRQLGWRDFAYHLLYHFPETPESPLRKKFEAFPWLSDPKSLKAWQRGKTGYPIVDAGMRQLWKTGWMHNRVRMIVGSFLVKDLLLHWIEGAKWFWDTLVDADLANNVLGWQWVGGCGADAAPYFRIFNPVTQGQKFDPQGEYIKKWIPELTNLSSKWIHHPWKASPLILKEAGITLGEDYPHPIVDHAKARNRALQAFQRLKKLN